MIPEFGMRGTLRAALSATAVCAAACTATGLKPDIPECALPQSAECEGALERIQVLRYEGVSREQLVAAASRAAGDLNFDLVRRDDTTGLVQAKYIGSAPTHKDQLDSRFHAALGPAAAQPVQAQITIGPAAAAGSTPVRLRLIAPGAATDSGSPAMPVDRVAPYQLFFEQLSLELDGRSVPTPQALEDLDKGRRPNKPAVLPGSPTVPSGL